MISRVLGIYRESGFDGLAWRLASFSYKRFLRPVLPNSGHIRYAGVVIGCRKFGDRLLPSLYNPPDVADVPDYEEALVTAIKRQAKGGDTVVVVGGGLGVTCVIAAWAAGGAGRVECFEGDRKGVDAVGRVARDNGVAGQITVHHAVVATNIAVYGNTVSNIVVQPEELPPCDFLELDCEGAEINILRDMKIMPRSIAVETHGVFGAPTDKVYSLLRARGYEVEDLGWAEPRYLDACQRNDIKVLLGTLPPKLHPTLPSPGFVSTQ